MPWTLPNEQVPTLRLEVVDGPADSAGELQDTGDAAQFVVNVATECFLRLCLVWTDPPGNGLQNTLHVMLEHSSTGRKWVGNTNRRTNFAGPDPGNNVQVIRLETPDPGSYLVQVSATNLLRRPQAFALVATGRSPVRIDQRLTP
jgi:serine protease AprX